MHRNPARVQGNGPPIRYFLVLWLLVLSAVAFLDRTNISIAGVEIGAEFKIDNARLGWVFSAFLIGYASFQIPSGVLARRFGPRRLLACVQRDLVGSFYGADRLGSSWTARRSAGSHRSSRRTRSRRGNYVSGGEPVCRTLV